MRQADDLHIGNDCGLDFLAAITIATGFILSFSLAIQSHAKVAWPVSFTDLPGASQQIRMSSEPCLRARLSKSTIFVVVLRSATLVTFSFPC